MDNTEELLNKRYNRILKNIELYSKLYEFNKTPLAMSILVTNRCTLRCKHCFNHRHQGENSFIADSDELSLEEYEKISKSMGSFMKALFSGGEPFMRKDFKDIVLMFAQNNNLTHISITTNAQDTDNIFEQTSYILSKLNDKVNLSLGFSLEGFEEVHDIIRGKGTFKNSINTWNKCQILKNKYSNFDMYICSTINTINEDTMCDFLRWGIEELFPDSVALLKVRQNPRDGEYLKEISLDNYYKSMNIIKDAIKVGKLGDRSMPQTYINAHICEYVYKTLNTNKKAFDCFAGKYGGFINYNGDVGGCEILKPYANLADYDYNFNKLWRDFLDDKNKENNECYSCTHETEGIIPSLFFGNNKLDNITR